MNRKWKYCEKNQGIEIKNYLNAYVQNYNS